MESSVATNKLVYLHFVLNFYLRSRSILSRPFFLATLSFFYELLELASSLCS